MCYVFIYKILQSKNIKELNIELSFKIKYVTLCPRLKLMCFSKVTFAFCTIPKELQLLLDGKRLPSINEVSKIQQAEEAGLETAKWKAAHVGS